MSSISICSTTFICVVLTVTVTWSGLGSSSASMWRVSSDSHLACGAFGLGREGDRAADLDDHVRHGLAHAGDQLVELGQALGALAVELAHVQVQHRGAGVVAVHRLLDLGFHGDRDVFREVGGNPFGAVRRGGDNELFLVFGEQGSVEKVHGVFLFRLWLRLGWGEALRCVCAFLVVFKVGLEVRRCFACVLRAPRAGSARRRTCSGAPAGWRAAGLR